MPWVDRRFIFKPTGEYAWSQSHAQVPTALVLEDRIRIYYATRDALGRSLTSFIDTSRADPTQILYVHNQPILPLGKPGTHDEDGAMVGCVVPQGNDVLLYYTGWSRGESVPYRVSVGLAKSNDGGITFDRVFDGPVVDRTPQEPYMTMSPYVLDQGEKWKMWYGSGVGWTPVEGKMEPLYIVKYAESRDGLAWVQPNSVSIPQAHPLEANTRPSVLRTSQGYEMWFSYRHSQDFRDGAGAYRIGHAISSDGMNWRRLEDPSGLQPGGDDWDSHMIAYPNVVEVDGRRLLFYNGNSFGKTGFGVSVWE